MRSLGFLFAAILSCVTALSHDLWLTDFDKAKAKAKAEKKLVLIDFTGSDWCYACIRLEKEILSKPEFKDYAEKNLVLMKVDLPLKPKLPKDEKARREELMDTYSANFGELYLVDSTGQKLALVEWDNESPKDFVAKLEQFVRKHSPAR
jgi:protein disulfide-isomerase